MDLAADEFTKRSVDHLMSTEASFSVEGGRDDDRLVVPRSVRPDFDRNIRKALLDTARDCFGIHALLLAARTRLADSLTEPVFIMWIIGTIHATKLRLLEFTQDWLRSNIGIIP